MMGVLRTLPMPSLPCTCAYTHCTVGSLWHPHSLRSSVFKAITMASPHPPLTQRGTVRLGTDCWVDRQHDPLKLLSPWVSIYPWSWVLFVSLSMAPSSTPPPTSPPIPGPAPSFPLLGKAFQIIKNKCYLCQTRDGFI